MAVTRGFLAQVTLRRVQLVSGLVLFSYVASHLLNHSLGLVSLQMMEEGRGWFLTFWWNPIGTLALYGALVIHLALALWTLYQRRRLKMPAREAAQLSVGLMIPFLLIEHIVGTRMAFLLYGPEDSYTYVILVLWLPWVRRGRARSLGIGDQSAMAKRDGPRNQPAGPRGGGDPQIRHRFRPPRHGRRGGIGAGRCGRDRGWTERRCGVVRITYPGGHQVTAWPGSTILDISRSANPPRLGMRRPRPLLDLPRARDRRS